MMKARHSRLLLCASNKQQWDIAVLVFLGTHDGTIEQHLRASKDFIY